MAQNFSENEFYSSDRAQYESQREQIAKAIPKFTRKAFREKLDVEYARVQKQRAEKAIAIREQQREKRDQLRRTRAAIAEQQSLSIASGDVGVQASTTQGAIGGTQSQYAYNLSFLDQMFAFNEQIREASFNIASYEREQARKSKRMGTAMDVVGMGLSFL